MSASKLLTIAVVSTLLIGGMAAVGAAVPDAAADNADIEDDGPAADNTTNAENADDAGPSDENADSVGPSDGLPDQAADHVTQIHDSIDAFLGGMVDNLGETLSEFLGDGEQADESAEDADEHAEDADEHAEDGADEPVDEEDDTDDAGSENATNANGQK